jgi:hypothetical protein
VKAKDSVLRNIALLWIALVIGLIGGTYMQMLAANKMIREVRMLPAKVYLSKGFDPEVDHGSPPIYGSYQVDEAVRKVLVANTNVFVRMVDGNITFVKTKHWFRRKPIGH